MRSTDNSIWMTSTGIDIFRETFKIPSSRVIDARKLITQPDESVNENKTNRRVESCGEIVSYYSVVMCINSLPIWGLTFDTLASVDRVSVSGVEIPEIRRVRVRELSSGRKMGG